jgi:hypothetical protein
VIRVYGDAGNVIQTHEHEGGAPRFEKLLKEAKQSVALKAAPGIG